MVRRMAAIQHLMDLHCIWNLCIRNDLFETVPFAIRRTALMSNVSPFRDNSSLAVCKDMLNAACLATALSTAEVTPLVKPN
jgi:hypothetical protein